MDEQGLHPNDGVIISFMTLRRIVGLLGIALALMLILGSFFLDDPKLTQLGNHIYSSISAYNYSHMCYGFVGIVCGIALFLLSYHGYETQDSVVSKLAGVFALVVAFVPTARSEVKGDPKSIIHYLAAAAFFTLLAYMSVFVFTISTAPRNTKQKKQRNRIYRICGIGMAAAVSCIALDNIPAIRKAIPLFDHTILFETIGLTPFGISWLVKGEFILKDDPLDL